MASTEINQQDSKNKWTLHLSSYNLGSLEKIRNMCVNKATLPLQLQSADSDLVTPSADAVLYFIWGYSCTRSYSLQIMKHTSWTLHADRAVKSSVLDHQLKTWQVLQSIKNMWDTRMHATSPSWLYFCSSGRCGCTLSPLWCQQPCTATNFQNSQLSWLMLLRLICLEFLRRPAVLTFLVHSVHIMQCNLRHDRPDCDELMLVLLLSYTEGNPKENPIANVHLQHSMSLSSVLGVSPSCLPPSKLYEIRYDHRETTRHSD